MWARHVSLALRALGFDLRGVPFGFNQVVEGAKVELEHTQDPLVATKIALDHLQEFPDYYKRLAVMERRAKAALKPFPSW